jgi:hypothetical protein
VFRLGASPMSKGRASDRKSGHIVLCGSSPPWLHPPRRAEQYSAFYRGGSALERTLCSDEGCGPFALIILGARFVRKRERCAGRWPTEKQPSHEQWRRRSDCVRDPNRGQFSRPRQPRQGHCIASIGLDPLSGLLGNQRRRHHSALVTQRYSLPIESISRRSSFVADRYPTS